MRLDALAVSRTRSSARARLGRRIGRRTRVALSVGLLAAGLGGCTSGSSGNSSVTATGKNLTVYVSASPVTAGKAGQDVLDAEQLAFSQKSSEITAFSVKVKAVDSPRLSDRARTAIQDTSAIAYVGEIAPGDSADTLGITNAQDLLQVAPTDTAVELTQSSSAVPGSPGKYYESVKTYGRTFARVTPTTAAEARATIQEMQSLRVSRLYIGSDASPYGQAMALAVKDAAAPSVTVTASLGDADAVFYAAAPDNAAAAASAFNRALTSNPRVKLFAPSSMIGTDLPSAITSPKATLYVSQPGFLPATLNAQGQAFASAFLTTYHHKPAPEAVFGYEAMNAVMDMIKQAGASANNRSTVVHDFFAIKNRPSALGTYSINANGDTSIAPFVFSRLQAGALVPVRSLQAQG
jgi:branched-chain amino acid transport system substrate-binding protein